MCQPWPILLAGQVIHGAVAERCLDYRRAFMFSLKKILPPAATMSGFTEGDHRPIYSVNVARRGKRGHHRKNLKLLVYQCWGMERGSISTSISRTSPTMIDDMVSV